MPFELAINVPSSDGPVAETEGGARPQTRQDELAINVSSFDGPVAETGGARPQTRQAELAINVSSFDGPVAETGGARPQTRQDGMGPSSWKGTQGTAAAVEGGGAAANETGWCVAPHRDGPW